MGNVSGLKGFSLEKVKPVLKGIVVVVIVAAALGAILNGSLALHGSDKAVQLDTDHHNILPICSIVVGGLALIALIGGGIYLKRKQDAPITFTPSPHADIRPMAKAEAPNEDEFLTKKDLEKIVDPKGEVAFEFVIYKDSNGQRKVTQMNGIRREDFYPTTEVTEKEIREERRHMFQWTPRELRLSNDQFATLRKVKELNEGELQKIGRKLEIGEKILYKMNGRMCMAMKLATGLGFSYFDDLLKEQSFEDAMDGVQDIGEVSKLPET